MRNRGNWTGGKYFNVRHSKENTAAFTHNVSGRARNYCMKNNIEHLSLFVKETSTRLIWLGESTFSSGPHEWIFPFAAKSINGKPLNLLKEGIVFLFW